MPRAHAGIASNRPPRLQPLATLTQAAPVQNTYYTILDTVLDARIYAIGVRIQDTGETLQVRLTIDGLVIESAAVACVAGQNNLIVIDNDCLPAMNEYTITTGINSYASYSQLLVEGRSVKIEVRKTTAAGAGTLYGRVQYGIYG